MKISGLSNQWCTRQRLIEDFADIKPEMDASEIPPWGRRFLQLIEQIELLPGVDVYIGTSHSLMNFSTRDVTYDSDRTKPFAFVTILGYNEVESPKYRIETRRIFRIRPTTDWEVFVTGDPMAAAMRIQNASKYSDSPVCRVKKSQ